MCYLRFFKLSFCDESLNGNNGSGFLYVEYYVNRGLQKMWS